MVLSRLFWRLLPVWAICFLATILQAAPPLDVYARLPQTEMVKLSPSGKRIAVVESSDQRRVIVMEGDKLLRSAALGTQKIRDLIWAGESNLLLNVARKIELNVTLSDSVAETTTMIMLPLDNKPIWALFERDKAIFAGVQGFLRLFRRWPALRLFHSGEYQCSARHRHSNTRRTTGPVSRGSCDTGNDHRRSTAR
jgi:hypothetical protein